MCSQSSRHPIAVLIHALLEREGALHLSFNRRARLDGNLEILLGSLALVLVPALLLPPPLLRALQRDGEAKPQRPGWRAPAETRRWRLWGGRVVEGGRERTPRRSPRPRDSPAFLRTLPAAGSASSPEVSDSDSLAALASASSSRTAFAASSSPSTTLAAVVASTRMFPPRRPPRVSTSCAWRRMRRAG